MKRPSISFNKDALLDFLLRHGEKFVVAALGLGALWLAWGGINALRLESVRPNQLPSAIQAGARRAEEHIGSVAELPADLLPAHPSLTAEIDGWRTAKPEEARGLALLDKPLFEDLARRPKPNALPVEDLRAVAGIAVLEVKQAGAAGPGQPGDGRGPRPPRGGRPEPPAADPVQQPQEPLGQPGRVVPYVIVTGLIPIAKQQAEFDQKFAEVGFRDEKLDTAIWTDFEVERSTVEAGKEAWQKLDQAAVLKLRIAQWAAADANRVPVAFQIPADRDGRDVKITPFGFCGPLPTRIDEPWGPEQFHPLVLDAVRKQAAATQQQGRQGQPALPEQQLPPGLVEGGAGAFNAPEPLAPEAVQQPGAEEPQGPPHRMFRFIDTSVEPGKSYRYRVRLKVRNPNFGLDPQYIAEPALAADQQLVSPPSDATTPVRLPDPVVMLASRLAADDVKRLKLKPGMFELVVMAPSQKTGNYSLRSVVTEIGGVANVDESLNKPNDMRFKGEKTVTNRILLDVIGQQADPAALAPTRGGRQAKPQTTGPAEPLEMIFMKRDGSLELVSAAESEPRIVRYRDTLYPPEAAAEGGPGFAPGGSPLDGAPFNPFQTQPPR
ncbi:MAG: hypothetical protein RLZZ21_2440 [Planctomycetota bacterium]